VKVTADQIIQCVIAGTDPIGGVIEAHADTVNGFGNGLSKFAYIKWTRHVFPLIKKDGRVSGLPVYQSGANWRLTLPAY